MKQKILSSLAIMLIAMFAVCSFTGCTTAVVTNPNGTVTTNNVINAAAIVPVIDSTVPIAVEAAINKDTNSVAYFNAAVVLINTLSTNGTTDPTAIQNALNGLKVNNPNAKLVVQGAFAIYQSFAASAVVAKLDSSQFILVLNALSSSISQGVAYSTVGTATGGTPLLLRVKK